MQQLKILNKKEIKIILEIIKRQWDADFKEDYCFLMNDKNKIFIVNKDIAKIDFSRIRINNLGLYFGELKNNSLRLSIEGSQIIGKDAKKNILELNDIELESWVKGEDINIDSKLKGFVIIKNKNDFYGSGKIIENKLLNFVPKSRRLRVIN